MPSPVGDLQILPKQTKRIDLKFSLKPNRQKKTDTVFQTIRYILYQIEDQENVFCGKC